MANPLPALLKDSGSPGFGSIEQYRLHDGVKDPDFSAGAEK